MTTQTLEAQPTPASGRVTGNPWRPSVRGVALATWIELLRRRPSARGYMVYGVTVAVIIGLGVLVAVVSDDKLNSAPMELVLVLVLGAGMLIGPSLSATSINGDSSEGVLAPLQMSRLSAGDLAVGKLLASWAVCFAALLTTTPFLVYAYARSGWHPGELALVLCIILFVVLAVTAMGLAWSAIAARAVASVALTHLTTGLLAIGTLLIFAFTLPLVSEDVTVTNRDFDWNRMTAEQQSDPNFDVTTLPCVDQTSIYTLNHTETTAWMLLINPVVVVIESAPVINPETYEKDGRAAPGVFAILHQQISDARLGPMQPQTYNACTNDIPDQDPWQQRQTEQALLQPNPWPGLGTAAALLLGSMWIVVRRLRVPYKKLRTGTRVA